MRTGILLASAALGANPIRRVVTLMQNMQKEVEAEGEKEAALVKEFLCYCKTNDGALAAEAEKAEQTANQKNAEADEAGATKKRLDEEVASHKQDRSEAKEALAKATEIRKKEKAAFNKASGETRAYIDATDKALVALKKGKGGAFLQTSAARELQQLISSEMISMLDVAEQQTVTMFLQNKGDYHSVSGEIIGILTNMRDEFDKSLGGIVSAEDEAKANFKSLKAAKQEEIQAATDSIESKQEKAGQMAVKEVESRAAADAATKDLADAQEFLVNLKQACAEKEAAWEVRQKQRADEIKAIGEAIEVLNDDDALDIFKKAVDVPAPAALLQTGSKKASPRMRAAMMLKSAKFTSKSVALLATSAAMQLQSKQGVDFSKILKMIDDMVSLLKDEQAEDNKAKEFGEKALRDTATEKKETETKIASLQDAIAEFESGIEAQKATIKDKNKEIKALDKSAVEATETRKKEHAEYEELVGLNTSAIQLLEKAKNKLNRVYNPNLYKEPEQRELTEEERILQGAGQDIGDTTAQTTIAGTEQTTTVFLQKKETSFLAEEQNAPPPPPATFEGDLAKNGKSSSVISLLDNIMNDLKTELTEAEGEEKNGQKEYETLMADTKKSRAQAASDIVAASTTKAELEENLNNAKDGLENSEADLNAVIVQIAQLHNEYDFILQHFDERKEARTSESEGLVKAKAVLSGAKFE